MPHNNLRNQLSNAPTNHQQDLHPVPAFGNLRCTYADGEMLLLGTLNMLPPANGIIEESRSSIRPNRPRNSQPMKSEDLFHPRYKAQLQAPISSQNHRHNGPPQSRNAVSYPPTSHGHFNACYFIDSFHPEVQQLPHTTTNTQTPHSRLEGLRDAPENRAPHSQGVRDSCSMGTPVVENQPVLQKIRPTPNIPSSYRLNDKQPEFDIHRGNGLTKKQLAVAASPERRKQSKKPQVTKSVAINFSKPLVNQRLPDLPLPPISTSNEQRVVTAPAETRQRGQMLPEATGYTSDIPRLLKMDCQFPYPENRSGDSLPWVPETNPVIIKRRKRIYEIRKHESLFLQKHGPSAHRHRTEALPDHREELKLRNPNCLTKVGPSQQTEELSQSTSHAIFISEPRGTSDLTCMNPGAVEEKPMASSSYAVVQGDEYHWTHSTHIASASSRGQSQSVTGSRPRPHQIEDHIIPSRVSSHISPAASRSNAQEQARLEQQREKLQQEAIQLVIKNEAERQILALDRKEAARKRASLEHWASHRAHIEEELIQARADASRERKYREYYERLYESQEQKMFMMRLKEERMQELKEEAKMRKAAKMEGDSEFCGESTASLTIYPLYHQVPPTTLSQVLHATVSPVSFEQSRFCHDLSAILSHEVFRPAQELSNGSSEDEQTFQDSQHRYQKILRSLDTKERKHDDSGVEPRSYRSDNSTDESDSKYKMDESVLKRTTMRLTISSTLLRYHNKHLSPQNSHHHHRLIYATPTPTPIQTQAPSKSSQPYPLSIHFPTPTTFPMAT